MSRFTTLLPLVLVGYLLLVPPLLAARVWLHHDTTIAVHHTEATEEQPQRALPPPRYES